MTSILDFMTQKHRDCDDAFAAAEEAVSLSQWDAAAEPWRRFSDELERHLQMEELVLFPEFEQVTGSTNGPTGMMRMEHQQIRGLIHQLDSALSEQQDEEFLGLSETLMVLMQQHNMKEEQMLYPMADQAIPASDAIIDSMQRVGG
jgi:hemerythrin-like domain-containing protein